MGQAPSLTTITTPNDNRHRTSVIIVPPAGESDVPPHGRPLVVALHGAGGTAHNMISTTRWDQLAKREGFVVAFPNGTPSDELKRASFLRNPQTWNSGEGTSLAANNTSAHAKNVDDVAFLTTLIQYIISRTTIDARRIYIAGHSNGAAMAYRFARERPELVAAVGVMAGHLQPGLQLLQSPVSLLSICGDQDPFAPLEGGLAGTRRKKKTTRAMILNAYDWAHANGLLSGESCGAHLPHVVRDDAELKVVTFGPNKHGTEVRQIVIKQHGHAWAGGSQKLPGFVMGPSSKALNATDEMWKFFCAKRKPLAPRS